MEERRKIYDSCYILATSKNLLSKYGDFRNCFLEIWGFGSFFLQKNFYMSFTEFFGWSDVNTPQKKRSKMWFFI